jgi:23S rRNA U2552 (ribose-2'-O)-methylase RlmE/FtsJ
MYVFNSMMCSAAPGGWTQVALQIVGSKSNEAENEKNKNPSITTVKNSKNGVKINPEREQKIGKVISVDIRGILPRIK